MERPEKIREVETALGVTDPRLEVSFRDGVSVGPSGEIIIDAPPIEQIKPAEMPKESVCVDGEKVILRPISQADLLAHRELRVLISMDRKLRYGLSEAKKAEAVKLCTELGIECPS